VQSLTGLLNGGQTQEQYFKAGIPELTPIDEVTDEFGSYTRTTITDVDSVKITVGGSVDETTGIQVGQWALKFITEEALDSIVLDNQNAWEKWVKEVGPKYIHSDFIDEILSVASYDDYDGTSTASGTAVIMTDAGNALPTLLRDGGVRVGKKMFSEFTVSQESTEKNVVYVYAQGQADYYVSDESAKAWYDDFYKNDEYSNSKETLKDGRPQYVPIIFSVSYTVKEDGGQWKIAEYNNLFSVQAAYLTRPDSADKVKR
jgi:hypothetical protein